MNEKNNPETIPELGTAEAAVRSCVNLISRATGQPEELLAYWLDLYYQVRCKLEAPKPTPFLQNAMDAALARAAAAAHEQVAKAVGKPSMEEAPGEPPKKSSQAEAVKFKRETLQRLEDVRKHGVSIPRIVAAADGNISESQILSILEAKSVPIDVYRVLAAALDRIIAPKEASQ